LDDRSPVSAAGVIPLAQLNQLSVAEFAAALGSIFEHSPWVPERAAAARPFQSRLHLLETLLGVVEQASLGDQMALIRAHPQLGTRGRTALTQASATEQRRAGLDACSGEELAQLDVLNAAYVAKFSMPFILAVRGHDPASIIASMKRRVSLDANEERRTALGQIGLIAGFRLADTVLAPAGAEILALLARLTQAVGHGGSGAAVECIREWMLAAGLDVSAEADWLMGRRYGVGGGKRLLLGVHYDTAAAHVNRDGPLGVLVGLAALQELKSQGKSLPFDVLLVAWPDAFTAGPGDFSLSWHDDLNPDDWRGCVAWSGLSGGALASPDGRAVAALLGAYPSDPLFDLGGSMPARAGTASIVPRLAVPCTPAALDRAVTGLRDFLLQTEKPDGYNG
jgi:beta-ureidopropionase / N-carbamoyl-L-amino-acid hydrolase